MNIVSPAWRTDIALLQASGSSVEHHADHCMVATPANPAYQWGNFLLLRQVPAAGDLDRWLAVFDAAFPGSGHVAIGLDGDESDLDVFAARGFDTDVSAVMTTDRLHPAPTTADGVVLRRLGSDDDWAQRVALAVACDAGANGPAFAEFARLRALGERTLVEAGLGDWFGAFDDDRMVAGLGIFRAGPGLARYQEVETHPAHRRRGLARVLVHAAGTHALNALGSATLVIVADPSYHAYRLYEQAGFRRTGSQLQVSLVG